MADVRKMLCCVLLVWLCGGSVAAKDVRHYVFFNRDRERIGLPPIYDPTCDTELVSCG